MTSSSNPILSSSQKQRRDSGSEALQARLCACVHRRKSAQTLNTPYAFWCFWQNSQPSARRTAALTRASRTRRARSAKSSASASSLWRGSLVNRKIAPARHARDTNGNHGMLGDLHRLKLRVTTAQESLRLVVLHALTQDVGVTMEHHPAKPAPILLIAIDHDGHLWVLGDVPQALEASGPALGLFIDRYVKRRGGDNEADRHDVGHGASIGRCKMPDPALGQEANFAFR